MNRNFDSRIDYYHVLGVSSGADEEMIRNAYRQRAKELHPDANPSQTEQAEQQFRLLTEAYEVLGNANLRRMYDQARWRAEVEQKKREQQQQTYTYQAPPPLSPTQRSIVQDNVRQIALWIWLIPMVIFLLLLGVGLLLALNIGADKQDEAAVFLPTLQADPLVSIPEDVQATFPITANADWEPIVETYNGVEMVFVPPGCFVMGEEPVTEEGLMAQTQCFTDGFWIDRYEVSNVLYNQLDPDGLLTDQESYWRDDARPRENIAWAEAIAFCELRGLRLPTVAEWEYAARGSESWRYPWGNDFVPDYAVFRDNSDNATAPIGSKPAGASWVGAADMVGNVWEWVADGFGSETYRILRGGSGHNNEVNILSEVESYFQFVENTRFYGFRCAR